MNNTRHFIADLITTTAFRVSALLLGLGTVPFVLLTMAASALEA